MFSSKILLKIMMLSVFLSLTAHSQFREEIGTLETMYESRARTVLNTILRPQEYSLVVSVDIDRDEQRLQKLAEEIESDLLPGMPGGIGSENPAFANQLYDMKTKVDIHLILSSKISKEKEATIGNLLKVKLHLDDKNGDTLIIERTDLPSHYDQAPGDVLPELSWKMWGMLIGLLFLLGSLFFMYLNRKSEGSEKRETKTPERDLKAEEEPPRREIKETVSEKTPPVKQTPEDIQVDPDEILFEEKQQIISLATQYPVATAQALFDHFQDGHEKDVLIVFDVFGWQTSKKLFSELSPRTWGRLGILLQEKKEFTDSEILTAFQTVGKIIIRKFLELGEMDSTNPFNFFWKLSPTDKKKVLAFESPTSLAIICIHGNKDQTEELLQLLSNDMAEAVTVAISKISTFSDQQIKAIVESLKKRLDLYAQNPEVTVDGIAIAAKLLRSSPAEKELPLFLRILEKNPDEAEKIRNVILVWPDIGRIPKNILSEALGMLELDTIVKAMRDAQYETSNKYILSSLPPKKAYMVERDLELDVIVSPKERAMSQRELITSVTAILRLREITLTQVFSETAEKTDGGLVQGLKNAS